MASKLGVSVLVEPEDHVRAAHEHRPPDQVRLLDHQVDGFFLRSRQRALLEHRAARADEVEETVGVDMLLQEGPVRRGFVDVDRFDVDTLFIQETPGVLAGRSGGFGVEGRLRHEEIVR